MQELQRFKNHIAESRLFSFRVMVTAILVLALSSILVLRYRELQVVHYEDYATQSDKNRILVQTISPQRGLIFDKNGMLLADNRPSHTLSLTLENIPDIEHTISLLSELVEITPKHIQEFENAQQKSNRRPYQPVPLRYRLSEAEIAKIAVNNYRLPGVEVEAQLVRHYPEAALFAHSVGYVGKINDREWNGFDEEAIKRYQSVHTIGKIGLEKYYEEALFGEVGYRHVEINARMRVLRTLEQQKPVPGKNLELFIDSHLQRAALEAMDGRRGAVVALDVKTGGVLAILSTPSYDPNLFVTGISYKNYNALRDDLDVPLFDRTIKGRYPPASTLKPIIGLAALYNKVVSKSYSIFDPGYYQLENDDRLYRDWKRTGHGRVNMHKAIVQSSDTYFYDIAFRTGIDRIHDFGLNFGFGRPTGVDMPGERRGLWPSREWKKAARRLPWFPGDTLNVGIGQGDTLATPLQLAVMANTIANKGKLIRPRLVHKVGDELTDEQVVQNLDVDESDWDYIFKTMSDVIHAHNGTAKRIGFDSPYKMAGKTGTAQVVGIKQGEEYDSEALKERHRDHGLFVGFAPVNNPQIAVAVIVENSESGSGAAAPVAKKLFDAHILSPRLLSQATSEPSALSLPTRP